MRGEIPMRVGLIYALLVRATLMGSSGCGGQVISGAGGDGGFDGASEGSEKDVAGLDGPASYGPASDGNAPETSLPCGAWGDQCCSHACDVGLVCSGGTCIATDAGTPPLSCAPGGPGMTDCGKNSESCCASPEVATGAYYRAYGYSTSGAMGPLGESAPATISGFRLDKYDVTVGRFRQFVNAWSGGAGYLPPAGSGKHAHLNGGSGLANSGAPGTYETGWVASDDDMVAPTSENLECYMGGPSWTASAGANENLPILCENWYEAYAFCIWDGGFLPSEAEWGYAAAGGTQERDFPWGSTVPDTGGNQYAVVCVGNPAPVGTATLGAGLWGQLDLEGEAFNWTLDWYGNNYVVPCTNCAFLKEQGRRTSRGCSFGGSIAALRSYERTPMAPATRYAGNGFRCARVP
jgi:formylglycine-generating enzyme